MKTLILKTPPFLFLLLIVAYPLIFFLFYYGQELEKEDFLLSVLGVIQIITIGLWMSSLIAYFSFEGNSKKNDNILYTLTWFYALLSLLDDYAPDFVDLVWYSIINGLLQITVIVITLILIIPKIKQVFYARSIWFIVLELLFLPIGVVTLTSAIQQWEKSDKS